MASCAGLIGEQVDELFTQLGLRSRTSLRLVPRSWRRLVSQTASPVVELNRAAVVARGRTIAQGAHRRDKWTPPRANKTTVDELAQLLVDDYKANGPRSLDRLEDSLTHLRLAFAGQKRRPSRRTGSPPTSPGAKPRTMRPRARSTESSRRSSACFDSARQEGAGPALHPDAEGVERAEGVF